jgi:hypothetical protein
MTKIHKFIWTEQTYDFHQTQTMEEGWSLTTNIFLLWLDLWQSNDFRQGSSLGLLGVTKRQLQQEQFWQGLDGYKRSEPI